MQSIYGLTKIDLEGALLSSNLRASGAEDIFKTLYKNLSVNFENNPRLSKDLKSFSKESFSLKLPKILDIQKSSQDETVKFLVGLEDGQSVETVLVPFRKKYTICISTQVGCAMACSFCYTGTQGLTRNLLAHEIVGQYMLAWKWLKKNSNKDIKPQVVFMGQGEPLHNFDEVKKATEIFLEVKGLHLGPRMITLSTSGYLPGLKRFAEYPSINLALSLHSPFKEERDQLIPINVRYDLNEVLKVIDELPRMKKQFINCEYLLIKDFNDTIDHIDELERLLTDRDVIFNLIPFNEFPGSAYKKPSLETIHWFKKELESRGFAVMLRTTKGDDILAACGQLQTKEKNRELR